MGRGTVIGLLVFIVLENILGAFFVMGYFDLVSSYEELEGEYRDLQSLRLELEEDYQSLNTTYSVLMERHYDLDAAYGSLAANYSLLEDRHRDLEKLYVSLVSDYGVLESSLEVEEVLRIGNSLQSYYDLVRQEKGLDGTKGSWHPDEDQLEFAVSLASHDLGSPYLPKVEEEFEMAVGNQSYEMARSILDNVLVLIGADNYDPSVVKVGKILNFTCRHVHYESEVNNVYRAPVETLGLRSGDCDDYTILVAALFEAVGIESAVGAFKNATEAYHYMVLIHLDDLPGYRYWSLSDLSRFGLSTGKWILIEPQFPLKYQGEEWVEQWTLLDADEVPE